MSEKIDLSSLDFNNPGAWPFPVKMGACAVVVLVVIAAAWYLFFGDQRTQLNSLQAQEQSLREEFQQKQGRATNLEPLKQQLGQMGLMLQQMLRQLPSKNEMPDLIVDISQTALAAGVTNELFQPGVEATKEFYAEKPISLRMVGTYHQFGAFVSGVALLPRVVIMTMNNMSLTPKTDGSNLLVLDGTVKTYRYLDDEEVTGSSVAGGAQ